ncbi:MAG: thioredoxin domain-containing protein [Sulfurovum sp.]|nr:thioredoxin domain-containing protein [Sulfurovum sp.]
MGNPDAKVHIVEFFDPACETCAQFHPFVKNILKENKGKIKLTLRYATFHEGSEYIVKILEAAKKQGKYLETLDLAFQTQSHWAIHHKANPEIFWRFLPKIGLDMKKLAKDVMDPKLDKLIAQDMKDAKALGANKTPSYFVNGKPLQKFGYQELKDLINSEL